MPVLTLGTASSKHRFNSKTVTLTSTRHSCAAPGERLLVLGMGNEILRDDAIGLEVLRLAEERLDGAYPAGTIVFLSLQTGGLDLIYEVEGYDHLIVVDSYYSPTTVPGRIRVLGEENLVGAMSVDSAHLVSLPTALTLSRKLGYHTPKLLGAVVIDVGDECMEFGLEMTESVASAGSTAADTVCELVREHMGGAAS